MTLNERKPEAAIAAARNDRLMQRCVDRIRTETGVSLAFGGPVDEAGGVALRTFAGPTLGALPGVRLTTGEGLGGRAAALQRVISVNDYFSAPGITHTYDRIIHAESLRSLVAVPLIVRRRVVGMIYGAMRGQDLIGGRIEHAIAMEARALEQTLVIEGMLGPSDPGRLEVNRLRELLRATHRSLVGMASTAAVEPAAELRRLAQHLVDAVAPDEAPASGSILTTRETDVIRLASAGLSNRLIADSLGLTLHTVKGYMKSAMAKLSARTRWEAVVASRAEGLIL